MQDYDTGVGSGDDNVCVGNVWFSPYTAAELHAKKFVTDSQNSSSTWAKTATRSWRGDALPAGTAGRASSTLSN